MGAVVARRRVQGSDRSLVVAGISPEEARSVYSLRGAIQGLVVVEFVERAGDEDHLDFATAARTLQAAYQAGDVAVILDAKRRFYASLCSGARNPVALSLIERLCLRVSSLRSHAPGRAARNEVSAAEIGRIAAAVASCDAADAKAAMLDHLASVARWTLSTLETPPGAIPHARAVRLAAEGQALPSPSEI
jgi:DNA-binding GntR family transcriptional regulator